MMRALIFLNFIFLLTSCFDGSVAFYTQNLASVEEELLDASRTENFTLGKASKGRPLDILIVIDSSSSMKGHLDHIGQSLSSLLSVISEYDWQIAFTTVDHGDHERVAQKIPGQERWQDHVADARATFGKLMYLEESGQLLNRKILNSRVRNYEEIFHHTLSHESKTNCDLPPFCQNYLEQPLRALKSAMERSILDNADFFRKDADFVSIIITNEDERSEDSVRATSAKEVVKAFNDTFGTRKQFLAFNIIVQSEACLRQETSKYQKAKIGERIQALAELTNGENLDICIRDYSSNLQKISRLIKKQVEKSVILAEEPYVDSVIVEFLNSPEVPWSISGKRLVFQEDLKEGSQILVRYQAILEH